MVQAQPKRPRGLLAKRRNPKRKRESVARLPVIGECVFADISEQGRGLAGRRHFAVQDFVRRGAIAVERNIAILVGFEDRAIEADTGEEAAAARVAQDFSVQLQVGAGLSIAADRARSGGGLATDFELVTQKPRQAVTIAENENQVGGRSSDLKTEASR